MILTADYHTHTPYSHGKNTIEENVAKAKEMGLQEIGISDHGFSHLSFGIDKKKVSLLIEECKQAEKKYDMRVLVGMEANIRGESGLTDMTKKDYENFDLFICGKHVFISYENSSNFFNYFLGNLFTDKLHLKPSDSLIKRNTLAYINVIKNNPVDIISHLGYKCPCNVREVAKCAADYGTYIELNSKKTHLSDAELMSLVDTNVRFVIDSDAHSSDRVGDTKIVDEQLQRTGFPLDRIDNIFGRLPNFRFANFKKTM